MTYSPVKIAKRRNNVLFSSPACGAGSGGGASAVRQKVFLDIVAVGLEQHVGAAQLTNLLLRALDHAVAFAGLGVEDLASAGHLEALFGARFGLHLGHLALLGRKAPTLPSPQWRSV